MTRDFTPPEERLYEKIDNVLADIRRTIIDERSQTHGDPGLFAYVFAGMMRPYIEGLLNSGRTFQDVDAYNILAMMKLARQSVGGPVPYYEHSLDTAGYAVLRAAHLWKPLAEDTPGNREETPVERELREKGPPDMPWREALSTADILRMTGEQKLAQGITREQELAQAQAEVEALRARAAALAGQPQSDPVGS